jgi:hypothetical protein
MAPGDAVEPCLSQHGFIQLSLGVGDRLLVELAFGFWRVPSSFTRFFYFFKLNKNWR